MTFLLLFLLACALTATGALMATAIEIISNNECRYPIERHNPCYLYRNYRVNWFGAIMLAIFYNLLTPAVSICYWFYKLCTIGRKGKDDGIIKSERSNF